MPKLLKVLFPIVLLAAIISIFLNYHTLLDIFSTMNYTAPAEITELGHKLALTSDADLVYRASRPTIDNRDSFNQHCQSHDTEISVLGCYTNRTIYLYDITEPELAGIVESTAAHELLHGVWSRLNFFERDQIGRELESFYQAHPELSEELANYSYDTRLDELHSRVGTQYAELPATLENHYAKYFTNQDAIVAFYQQYSQKFTDLRHRLEELETALSDTKTKIDQLQSTYESRSATFNSSVIEFNDCANRAGCFTEAEFTRRRSALLAEQSELEDAFYELNDTINAYNVLVDEYNANVLHSRTLENATNSNANPIESL